jgi:hypothetical protein
MAVKRRLENDEIERQLKCTICETGLHSQALRGVAYKGAIQLDDGGGGGVRPIYTSRR